MRVKASACLRVVRRWKGVRRLTDGGTWLLGTLVTLVVRKKGRVEGLATRDGGGARGRDRCGNAERYSDGAQL